MKTFFLNTTSLILLLFVFSCNDDEPTTPSLSDLEFVVEDQLFASFEKDDAAPTLEGLCFQTDLLKPDTKEKAGLLSACIQSVVELGNTQILDMTVFFTLDNGEIESHMIIEAKLEGDKEPSVSIINRPEVSPDVIISGTGDYVDARGSISVVGKIAPNKDPELVDVSGAISIKFL